MSKPQKSINHYEQHKNTQQNLNINSKLLSW